MLDDTTYSAGDLMTRDVAVVRPETSLMAAVKLMAERRISGLVVVDDAGKVVGVVSEGDLLHWQDGHTETQARWLDMLAEGTSLSPAFLEGIRQESHRVKAVMSTPPITVTEDTPSREVAALMSSKHIKRVPVVRDGKLVGVISRSDLVRALAQDMGRR